MKKEKTIRRIHSITLTVIYSTALILGVMALLSSCSAPRFAVVAVDFPNTYTHNVLATAVPLNWRANRISRMGEITLLMPDTIKVKDTLRITRKHFTNY
jgi:hypothetical protein